MSRETATILDRAADLIEPAGKWTQDTFARRAGGRITHSRNPEAVCWCVAGAIIAVTATGAAPTAPARAALRRVLKVKDEALWNDRPNRTQAEVVAALRKAAAEERVSLS